MLPAFPVRPRGCWKYSVAHSMVTLAKENLILVGLVVVGVVVVVVVVAAAADQAVLPKHEVEHGEVDGVEGHAHNAELFEDELQHDHQVPVCHQSSEKRARQSRQSVGGWVGASARCLVQVNKPFHYHNTHTSSLENHCM